MRDLLKAKMTSTDTVPEELKEEEAMMGLKRQVSIDDRFTIVTINFKPEVTIADDDTVSILGEFTNWMPEIMERYDS